MVRAAALGAVAGMRSQLPLALLALAAKQGRFAADSGPPLALLRSPVALSLLGISAIGELIVDKLPFVPARHELGPMAGRVLFGALAGATLTIEANRSPWGGAFVGGLAAGLATDAAYHARVAAGRATALPDPLLGLMEDVLALGLGRLATSR
jgi:uncharacterized membrane protein